MKLILITMVLLFAVFLGVWFATGRDFRSFRDGLSSDFRNAGAQVLDTEDVTKLDSVLEAVIQHVHTRADRVTYRKLEFFAEQSAKALNEADNAKSSLAAMKPAIAEMQLKQSEFHMRNRHACLAELDAKLPNPSGQRKVPTAAEIGDAVCRQF